MQVKQSYIIQEAIEIKEFIEKNKRLPTKCTVQNVTLTTQQMSYLLSAVITAKFKSSVYSVVGNISSSRTKCNGVVNEKVSVSDYLSMCNNFVKFCMKNNRVPAYITIPSTKNKVSFELYVYCVTKIIVFFNENKKLPNYCLFNSKDSEGKQTTVTSAKKTNTSSTSTNKNIYISGPHYHSEGCNRLGQCTPYYCGVHSLHQILKKYNISEYNERVLAKFAGTTTKGTSHQGLETALYKASKNKLKISWKNFSDLGKNTNERFVALGKLISQNDTDAIIHNFYRNKYGHYEVIWKIDSKKEIVYVLNSLGGREGNSYKGYIEKRTFSEFATYIRNTPGTQPSVGLIRRV